MYQSTSNKTGIM